MAMMTMAIMMMMMMTIMVIGNPYIDTYSIDLLLPVRKNIIHHLVDIFVNKKNIRQQIFAQGYFITLAGKSCDAVRSEKAIM